MGKRKGNKTAHNNALLNKPIQEPDDDVVSVKTPIDMSNLSIGEKKLLKQKERDLQIAKELENKSKVDIKPAGNKKKEILWGNDQVKKAKKTNSNKSTNEHSNLNASEKHQAEFQNKRILFESRNEVIEKNHSKLPDTSENWRDSNEEDNYWDGDGVKSKLKGGASSSGSSSQHSWRNKNEENQRDSSGYSSNFSRKDNYPFVGKSSYDNYSNYNKFNEKRDRKYQEFLSLTTDKRKLLNKKVIEKKGDLFSAPEDYSLAHCVAEDFSMGAGIAKTFRSLFKQVPYLLNQKQKTGGLAFLKENERFIYYLVTKELSRGKPTLYTLWMSLNKLKNHIEQEQVTKLAIPQIGCGLDRLDWFTVKQMLEFVFKDTDIEIVVYILDENNEETISKILRKCYVNHAVMPLTDIETGTGLVYFGSEDGMISDDIKLLSERYTVNRDYKFSKRAIGDIVKTVDRGEYLYGLIIKKTKNDEIDFEKFVKCLYNFKTMLKKDKTTYIAFQGFIEEYDTIIVDKFITLMQYILQDVEIWVCWPKQLENYCPPQKLC